MTLVFEFADNEGMLLVDLADLRTTLEYLGDNSKELGTGFGVSRASVNAILRRLLMLEREGGESFFGEPALQLAGFHADQPGRARHHQYPRCRPAHHEPGSTPPSCCGCCRAVENLPGWAIPNSRCWCSFR